MLLVHSAPDDVERLLANISRSGREIIGNFHRFLRQSMKAERRAHRYYQNRLFHKAFSYRDQVVVINISARQRSRRSYMRMAVKMKTAERVRLINRPTQGICL